MDGYPRRFNTLMAADYAMQLMDEGITMDRYPGEIPPTEIREIGRKGDPDWGFASFLTKEYRDAKYEIAEWLFQA